MIMRNSELLNGGNVILEKIAEKHYRVIVTQTKRKCFWFDSLSEANDKFISFGIVPTVPCNSQAELNWNPANQLRLVVSN